MEIKDIELIRGNERVPAQVHCEDKCDPGSGQLSATVKIESADRTWSRERSDFFRALQAIRGEMAGEGWAPICYGACVDIYPSGMCVSMALGITAYRMTMVKPALQGDMIRNIFDSGPGIEPSSVDGQEAYHSRWIESLRRNPKIGGALPSHH